MTTEAVIITNLTKQFDEITAVDSLTFTIAKGEIFGFLGHNGAGKTTTVRLLNGILSPTKGEAHVLGLNPQTDGSSLRKRTGVLTETPSIDERLTARENLRIYANLYDVPEAQVETRIEDLLEQFGLAERGDEKTGGYSKGMKQRLALARALLHQPEILFLDEPTSGLDPIAAREVRELILTFKEEGRTVCIATHNLSEAQRLCDRVAVLEHGKLLALGSLYDLSRHIGTRQRIRIEVEEKSLPHAHDVLTTTFDVTDIEQEGAHYEFSGVSRVDIPTMIEALVAQGVKLIRVEPLEASLEEMYFALHERNHSHE